MIEQDYILRMLQQFFEAIGKVVRRRDDADGDTADLQRRLGEMYETFFKQPAGHFYQAEKEDILDGLLDEGRSERDTFARMRMMAELMYQDGLAKRSVPERCDLLDKALYLFGYIEHNSRTYSWELEQKMAEIETLLTETTI